MIKEFGIAPLLAIQLKLLGYQIINIAYEGDGIPFNKITYKKFLSDQLREIKYYQFNLLYQSEKKLMQLCSDLKCDAAFLKATSYTTQDKKSLAFNKFMISHFSYVMQSDTGIPIRFLQKNWNIKMFGCYGSPYIPGSEGIAPFWGYQPQLYALYQSCCKKLKTTSYLDFSHHGSLPFCFDYGGVLKPHDVRNSTSILIELHKHSER